MKQSARNIARANAKQDRLKAGPPKLSKYAAKVAEQVKASKAPARRPGVEGGEK